MRKLVSLFTQLPLVLLVAATSVEAASPPQPGAIREQSKQTLDYYEFQNRLQQPRAQQGEQLLGAGR